MSDETMEIDDENRAELFLELERLQSELRRRLLTLVEHPGISEEFKSNVVVREWIK